MPLNQTWPTGSSLIDGLVRNPVIISLLITVIALIIFFAIMAKNLSNTTLKDKVKCGFWLFIVTMVLTAVHYHAMDRFFEVNTETQGLQDVMGVIASNNSVTDVAINPTMVTGQHEPVHGINSIIHQVRHPTIVRQDLPDTQSSAPRVHDTDRLNAPVASVMLPSQQVSLGN